MARIKREEVRIGSERIALVRATAHDDRKGVVMVPPLVGGSGMQQIRYFPLLRRAGYDVVSFDYRGHGQSDGVFSIGNSIADTRAVLNALVAKGCGEPLFGMGDCYGAIPLLRAARSEPQAMRALVLFNPVPNLQHMAGPAQLLRNHFFAGGRLRLRNPLDLKAIVATTNELLFPHVDKSRDHFGILDYRRARMTRVLGAYLADRSLAGVALADTRAVVIYGRSDEILQLDRPEREERYRDAFRRLLPLAEFRALRDGDHYMTNTLLQANEHAVACFDALIQAPLHPFEPKPRGESVPVTTRADKAAIEIAS